MADHEELVRDGFQDLLVYPGHGRSPRGFKIISMIDEKVGHKKRRERLISWDIKGLYLWEDDKILSHTKFPKSQQNYISCLVYIPKLGIFLGPALDMTFKIYNSSFRVLETIHHDERVILNCEYDDERDMLIMSGAAGVSVWRIFKNMSSNSFILEKQFRFEGCSEWVNKMIYEKEMNRIYAFSDQSVSVLNFRTRTVKIRLDDIHDAPLTCACWYPADQFYITSCSRGLLRVWSPHSSSTSGGEFSSSSGSGKTNMLHSFNAHTKAVAGIALHPHPGLLISAGMDNFIKVFDLESFTVVQSIETGQGINDFSLGRYQNYPVCLFSFTSGDITMWRIDSCSSEFGRCASDILSLNCFETLVDPRRLKKKKVQYIEDEDDSSSAITIDVNTDPEKSNVPDTSDTEPLPVESGVPRNLSSPSRPMSALGEPLLSVPSSIPGTAAAVKTADSALAKPVTAPDSDDEETDVQESARDKRSIVAFSGLDLQVISPSGEIKSRVDAESLIDGVRLFTFSVFQQLLFCVLDSGDIRIFCTKSPACVLLREIFVGSIGSDIPLALALCDGLSLSALRSSTTSKDMRGNPSPLNVDEALLVGTSSGTLLVLDTFQECATISVRQLYQGRVEALKYRKARSEFIGLGQSAMTGATLIKVWKIPEMTFMHEIPIDNTFAVWEISPTMNYICVGCSDGFSRLFNLIDSSTVNGSSAAITSSDEGENDMSREIAQGTHIEVLRQEGGHESEITSISFCDELRAYATAAMDCTIKFWDFEKRYIRAILFDSPPRDILFNPHLVGTILVSQKTQIVSVAMAVWEGDGLLQKVKDDEDPWDMGWLEEDAPTRITVSRPSSKRRVGSSRGKQRPTNSTNSDSVTFLTEEQMQMSLLELASGNEEKGLISADEYWKYYSTLGNMTTLFPPPRKAKKALNVRAPRFDLPVRKARKRFANKLKQKIIDEAEKAAILAAEKEERNEDEEIRTPQETDPSVTVQSRRERTINIRVESPHEGRHAFIKSAKNLQSLSRMFKISPKKSMMIRKKTVAFGHGDGRGSSAESNGGEGTSRQTTLQARPPSGGSSKSALSIIQRRNLVEVADDDDNAGMEFSEEYFVKTNGPPSRAVQQELRKNSTRVNPSSRGPHRNAQIITREGAISR